MLATLNGEPLDINDDYISLLLYGYGVYSSFVVSSQQLVLAWDYHVERMQSDSLHFLGLSITRDDIVNSVTRFLDLLGTSDDITCRITIFPGDFSLGAPHKPNSPHLMVTGRSGSSLSGKPLALKLTECDRPYAQYKITNISAALKRRAEAKLEGYDDALFTARRRITEGPTWNIFFMTNDKIITPPNDGHLLPGVTRRLLMDIIGTTVVEDVVQVDDLPNFFGAFASNAAIGVVPIQEISGIKFSHFTSRIAALQETYKSFPKSTLA